MNEIKRSVLFGDLPEEDLGVVLEALEEKSVSPGTEIISQGSSAGSLYIILDGSAEVFRGTGEEEKFLALLGAGRFFGETGLIDVSTRTATVRAKSPCRLAILPRERFNGWIETNPRIPCLILKAILTEMDARVRSASEEIRDRMIAQIMGDMSGHK